MKNKPTIKNKPMPKSSSPKIEDGPCIAMASAPMSTGQSTARERPLAVIVDDEIHCCELLGGWMAELGYRVATFDSAWPALDFSRTAQPAVLVCDVVMPGGLDGLGLAPLGCRTRYRSQRTPKLKSRILSNGWPTMVLRQYGGDLT